MKCWTGRARSPRPRRWPITADLENGWGDSQKDCAVTIRLAANTGLAGGTIEDAEGDGSHTPYDLVHAAERIAAAAEAARASGFVFVAHADGFLHGLRDLDDVICCTQSYEAAGADVIFAPSLPDLESIKAVCAAVKSRWQRWWDAAAR